MGEARSAVEAIKAESRQLRGGLAEELAKPTDHFSDADKQLLKFHGSYQQEDRDARKNRHRDGLGKHHMFMVRCKIPGGRLSTEQYLALDELASRYANGTLRFTTRQGIQFHGILKTDLQSTLRGINECLLTTLGACGDVNRNVMACPAPFADGIRPALQAATTALAEHLTPRSKAYHEIWLNGQSLPAEAAPEHEPIYGKVYLPRKFKIGLALPGDNCIDVYAQDLGLLAHIDAGKVAGYNVLVGGGMGMTHGQAKTFPHLAKPIGYIEADQAVQAAEAVVTLFRDHGNRADRKRARIKYLVHDWGEARFREVLQGYLPWPLLPAREAPITGFDTHLGWQPQGDGRFFYGICIENGRVKDEGTLRLRTAIRLLLRRFEPSLRLTALQDILLCDLPESARPEIEATLAEHGVRLPEQVSLMRRHSMACPAIPTCGLALSEAERSLPGILDQLEAELGHLGLEDRSLGVRMTGCPNGCARPYQSDIGIVGRSGEKYTLYVGGRTEGDRLGYQLQDLVPRDQLVSTLRPWLERYRAEGGMDESFGDFCARMRPR